MGKTGGGTGLLTTLMACTPSSMRLAWLGSRHPHRYHCPIHQSYSLQVSWGLLWLAGGVGWRQVATGLAAHAAGPGLAANNTSRKLFLDNERPGCSGGRGCRSNRRRNHIKQPKKGAGRDWRGIEGQLW